MTWCTLEANVQHFSTQITETERDRHGRLQRALKYKFPSLDYSPLRRLSSINSRFKVTAAMAPCAAAKTTARARVVISPAA